MWRKAGVIGAFAVLLVGVSAVAYASIPGPDGVIHGCYKTSGPAQGAVIVVDHTATCPNGYAALNWNQTGPAGPAGLSGVHVVTTVVPGALTVSVFCPEPETALSVALTIGDRTWSATPLFDSGGVKPIGYQVNTQSSASVHLTCATAT